MLGFPRSLPGQSGEESRDPLHRASLPPLSGWRLSLLGSSRKGAERSHGYFLRGPGHWMEDVCPDRDACLGHPRPRGAWQAVHLGPFVLPLCHAFLVFQEGICFSPYPGICLEHGGLYVYDLWTLHRGLGWGLWRTLCQIKPTCSGLWPTGSTALWVL